MAGEVPNNAPEARQCAAGLVSAFNKCCGRHAEKKDFLCGRDVLFSRHSFACGSSFLYPVSSFLTLRQRMLQLLLLYFLCVKDYMERKKIDFWLKTFSFNKDRFKDHLSLSSDYPNSYLLSGFFKLFFLIMFCNCL